MGAVGKKQLWAVVTCAGAMACGGGSTPLAATPPAAGRKDSTTVVNGDRREYLVSIPRGYDGRTAVPVVFMLHGSSGDGQRFFNTSGWKELGDEETVLTVYPSLNGARLHWQFLKGYRVP